MCEELYEILYEELEEQSVECSTEDLRRFARAELTWGELVGPEYDTGEFRICCIGDYVMTYEDLRAAVGHLAEHGEEAGRRFLDWYPRFLLDLGMQLHLPELAEVEACEDIEGFVDSLGAALFPEDRSDMVLTILKYMTKDFELLQAELLDASGLTEALREYGEMMDRQDHNMSLPEEERYYTKKQRREIAYGLKNEKILAGCSVEIQMLWKRFLEELCAEGDLQAIRIKAYANYGDDHPVYSCDWEASRDCALQMLEQGDDEMQAQSANTLGYIYYYGRCSDGVPDYEKAFRYFSLAAFFGYYEATYKIGDMLAAGKGIPRNETAAVRMYLEVYRACRMDFQAGDIGNPLADAALRMGMAVAKGMGDLVPDTLDAYSYYLEAWTAMRCRMQQENFFGNRTVMKRIEKGLEETETALRDQGIDVRKKEAPVNGIFMLQLMMDGGCALNLRIQRMEQEIALTFSRADKILLTVPEVSWCDRTDTMTFYVPRGTQLGSWVQGETIDDVRWDAEGGAVILLREGQTIGRIGCSTWTYRKTRIS